VSVTTVLVPVLEPEAEGLFENGDAAGLRTRARRLRARVARVDAIREELHDLLFPRWKAANTARPPLPLRLIQALRKAKPAEASAGYDPFVHLFGRSLPVDGASPKAVVEALVKVLAQDDAVADETLAAHLTALDPRAGERLRQQPRPAVDEALDPAIDRELAKIRTAMSAQPPALRAALDAVVRLSAWSFPVWRLDGEMLPDLLRAVGIGVTPGRARGLFETVADARPELVPLLDTLPARLPDFAGTGSFLTSGEVKVLAGALRLQRGVIARNAADSGENATLVMRHMRLLEEAVLFCEAEGLGLAEAAGVEWHDRER
jgi:hypothetical protein